MKIGERLKQLRIEHGLTQTELAKRLNIGQTTIAAYENCVHEPQIYALIAYADFFDCSLDYLVGRETDNNAAEKFKSAGNERKLLELYSSLNDELKDLSVCIMEQLVQSPTNK